MVFQLHFFLNMLNSSCRHYINKEIIYIMATEEIIVMNSDDIIRYLLMFLVKTSIMNDIAILTPIEISIS